MQSREISYDKYVEVGIRAGVVIEPFFFFLPHLTERVIRTYVHLILVGVYDYFILIVTHLSVIAEFGLRFTLTEEAYVADLANSTSYEYRLLASRLLKSVRQMVWE